MRNFLSRVNQENFVLYFSSLVGVLVLLSALGLSVFVVTRPEPLRPIAQAQVCASYLYFEYQGQSCAPSEGALCDLGTILPNEEAEVKVMLNTEGQGIVAADVYVKYNDDAFPGFINIEVTNVRFGENGFDESLFNLLKRVTDNFVEMHFFTFEPDQGPTNPVTGSQIHLATLVIRPQAELGQILLRYDFDNHLGCSDRQDGKSVVAAQGTFENVLRAVVDSTVTVEVVPTPTPTLTLPPTATPTPTLTLEPTNTPTPPTGIPTPTNTPIPTATPTPACFNAIDYNCDGKNSAVDFGLWLERFIDYVHSDGQIYDSSADLNNDGKISALDFGVFLILYQ